VSSVLTAVPIIRFHSLVDSDPERGSLACWLRAIARRTSNRFLRRRVRATRMQGSRLPSGAQVPDPHLVDPAIASAAGEETVALAVSLEPLRDVEGEDAYRLVNQYLAESSGLAGLPLRIDLGAGKFWHLWRKTKRFLQERLAPFAD
jgi:DNA-directed RNA polymerase specialized sigma24 family protein